jgi:hypothetical protein
VAEAPVFIGIADDVDHHIAGFDTAAGFQLAAQRHIKGFFFFARARSAGDAYDHHVVAAGDLQAGVLHNKVR